MKRRDFLKGTVAGTSMLNFFPAGLSAIERVQHGSGLERRVLGKTGERLSVLGFGGLVVSGATSDEAAHRVRAAIEAGVNYFDVAPSYGNAEDMLGPALQLYRKSVFLACKTLERSRDDAAGELERSLQKLRTDHFDLYQLHAVTRPEEVEKIIGPGGALEALAAARKAGKARFLGFSAHSVEAALPLMEAIEFDTILFPVNYAAWNAGNFGPQVLARARDKKMGILALKAMARGALAPGAARTHAKCWYEPLASPEEAIMGLRFTLSHPVTAAVPPGDEGLFALALELAKKFTPLQDEEVREIKERAAQVTPLFRYPLSA